MTAALGALAELVQNLDALTVGGSQNRWFYPRRLRHSATIHFRTAWPPAVRSRRATESEHSIKLSINQSSFELPSFPCMQNASPKASAWRTVHPPPRGMFPPSSIVPFPLRRTMMAHSFRTVPLVPPSAPATLGRPLATVDQHRSVTGPDAARRACHRDRAPSAAVAVKANLRVKDKT